MPFCPSPPGGGGGQNGKALLHLSQNKANLWKSYILHSSALVLAILWASKVPSHCAPDVSKCEHPGGEAKMKTETSKIEKTKRQRLSNKHPKDLFGALYSFEGPPAECLNPPSQNFVKVFVSTWLLWCGSWALDGCFAWFVYEEISRLDILSVKGSTSTDCHIISLHCWYHDHTCIFWAEKTVQAWRRWAMKRFARLLDIAWELFPL